MGLYEVVLFVFSLFLGILLGIVGWISINETIKSFNKYLEHTIDSKIERKDSEIMRRVHSITDYKIEGHEVRCHKRK